MEKPKIFPKLLLQHILDSKILDVTWLAINVSLSEYSR